MLIGILQEYMVITDKVLLIQPRHIYAPSYSENKYGHIYLPTSLLVISAILNKIGVQTRVVDENIDIVDLEHNVVGVNLLGAPYIPYVIDLEKKMFNKYGDDFVLLIGGQVVSGLSEVDFKSLFSSNTLNGNLIKNISSVFNVFEEDIPKKENVSLINEYELIGDKNLRFYLSKEFGFYLSQGCKYSCSFCAAQRSVLIDNKKTQVSEQYRDIDIALADFEYIIIKSIKLGIVSVQIYLSNLDLFQNPMILYQFADGVARLKKKYSFFDIRLRGLSNSRSFLNTHKNYSYIIRRMVDAGLEQIGFGVDGATPKVYKQTRKPQSVQESLDAVRICSDVYGMIPEILMVFGHNNIEDEDALSLAVKFCKDMQAEYGAVPRPHIAKDMVPGNDGWINLNNIEVKKKYYKNPMLFQNLDFTAIPSPITHPDIAFRDLVTKYYKSVCELPQSLTQLVLPELPSMSCDELAFVRLHNKGKYDI